LSKNNLNEKFFCSIKLSKKMSPNINWAQFNLSI